MVTFVYRLLLSVCLGGIFSLAHAAEALLKPLPNPDASRLSAAAQKELAKVRQDFDAAKPALVGDALAEAFAKIGAEYARFEFTDVAELAFHNAAQLSPYDGRWPYLEGVMAMAKKQTAQARDLFQTALALDQGYLPIRLRLADALIELNDLDGAKQVVDEILKLRRDLAPAYAVQGEIALKQKRYSDAIEALNQALKLDPQADQLYGRLTEAYAAQGNTKAAKDAKALTGKTAPTLIDPLVSGIYGPKIGGNATDQAAALFKQHRFDEARAKLGEALTANPKDIVALSIAARIEAEDGNMEGARKAAAVALQAAPENAIAQMTHGMLLEMDGKEAEAIAAYEKAVHGDLKLSEARLLLGNADMRHAQYLQAAEQYRQLATLQPENGEAYARLAAAQTAANKCADALKGINQTIAQRPKDGGALQVFVRLISTCPGVSQEDRTRALSYAKVLYQQRPDGPNSEALAMILAAEGKFQDAIDYQTQAIFEAVRAGDKEAAGLYKETMLHLQNKQTLEHPWPAQHPYLKPPLLTPGLAKPAIPEKSAPLAG